MIKPSLRRFVLLVSACVISSAWAGPAEWVGKPLPALDLDYLDAKPNLAGKAAIVEFWATWCPPCRKSIPHLNDISAKYKEKGLTILGISEDDDKKTIEAFRKSVPMDYVIALDKDGAILRQFGIEGIPQAFIVDKAGKIVWQGYPMDLDEAKLNEVLK